MQFKSVLKITIAIVTSLLELTIYQLPYKELYNSSIIEMP